MPVLCNTIISLEKQVDGICIIDNGGLDESLLEENQISCDLIVKHLESNQGIAKATNIGFDFLSAKSVDYVLLSDQDTIYPSDYVRNFISYVTVNVEKDVAAFCPVFFDNISSEFKPLYIKNSGFLRKVSVKKEPMPVFQAIASGLVVDIKKIREIGGMNESLFIDYVDFEWCWKINKAGYKILCLPQMKISHNLGSGVVSVGAKKISEHSSLRYYYITRNTFYLSLHSKYIPLLMKMQLFIKACAYPIGYSIFCKPHLKNAQYTLKGMLHGILGKLGKLC